MSCTIDVNGKCYSNTAMTSFVIGGIAATVSAIALIIIFSNYLDSTITTQIMNNVPLIKPEVINVLWGVAKWSGFVAMGGLGIGVIMGLFQNKKNDLSDDSSIDLSKYIQLA